MQIEVRSRDAEVTPELRQLAENRMWLALSRFGDRIAEIEIGLDDEQRCCVLVRGKDAWTVIVTEQDADPYARIGRAGDRVGQAVARVIKLDRRRDRIAIPWRRVAG